MQIGINISCLIFTRKLDVRYLWVDAFCTVQKGDENADWSHESQKMALI